jgi:hypothetical protein
MSGALAISVATALAWFAVYKLPFARPRVRTRIGMAVGGALGVNAAVGFMIVGTISYVGSGAMFIAIQMTLTGVSLDALFGGPVTETTLWALCLAVVGAVSWIGVWMAALHAARPNLDIPSVVNSVPWVRASLALSARYRWLVPLCGAVVEETFYRGAVALGLVAGGFEPAVAALIAGTLFTVTQMGMTQTAQQAAILGVSSVVVSVFGSLLVLSSGSLLPAVVLHGAFAAFYCRNSWTLARPGVVA